MTFFAKGSDFPDYLEQRFLEDFFGVGRIFEVVENNSEQWLE